MCNEDLKQIIAPKRKELLDIEDKKIESARKKTQRREKQQRKTRSKN